MNQDVIPFEIVTSSPRVEGLIPRQIVEELDKYIIGQDDAKRAVSIALRNRARRRVLPPEVQEEIYPKNIIMIGPTGVGKTEIARRLARLEESPFVKVEASKFTEVGYVGRDVDSIIRDLVEISVTRERAKRTEQSRQAAEEAAEERLLDLLMPGGPRIPPEPDFSDQTDAGHLRLQATRERLREMLQAGKLDDRSVEFEVSEKAGNVLVGFPSGAGMEELGIDLKDMMDKMLPTRRRRQNMKVSEARSTLLEEEANKLVDMECTVKEAIHKVEQTGIVFLDEIDKIVGRDGGSGPDVSRSGVQRDILPLIEGTTVFTKYGMVRTDHVLFIAAGAFHGSSPADLIPELQGRFPIRVELDPLEKEDFERILREPKNSLIQQYIALLKTEGIDLEFSDDAVVTIAQMAFDINEETENIGARRLHTIMEKVLEDPLFDAPEMKETHVEVDAEYVKTRLEDIVADTDLSKYIL
ncbi:MAG: ATP-dependent protease ATPase subunit HslU [bacterium]